MTAEELYGLPLDEFIGARDALARELRQRGEREEADAVRQLRKPSVPAWAINQLARAEGTKVRRLIEAEDELRRAHGASEDRFRDALAAERQTAAELVKDAARILTESGRPPTEATLERIAATLQAAAADEAHREELAEGRLSEELEPLGFEALAGVKLPKRERPRRTERAARPRRESAAQPRRTTAARPRAEPAARAADGAKKRLREALAAAKDEARRLGREAERAEREARSTRERADRARAEVDRLEQQLRAGGPS
jgi:hypothetical protein